MMELYLMMLNLRVSLHCLSGFFPSSVFMQQSPGIVGGSLCPGAETGLGFAWTVSSISMGSWSSGKGDDALAWTGGSWIYPLCYGSGCFRDFWTWMSHLDHGV